MKSGKNPGSSLAASLKNILQRHFGILLLVMALGVAAQLLYKDYGVSWDEKYNLDIARVNYRYIRVGNPELLTFNDRYYGPFFELLYYPYLRQFDFPALIYVRHRLNFLVFALSMFVFYALAYRVLKKPVWAWIATALLAFSPRIFADAFYNPKDIPLMITCITAGWTLLHLVDQIRGEAKMTGVIGAAGLHGIACAAAIATRVVGLVLVPISLLVWMTVFFSNRPTRKRTVLAGSVSLLCTVGFTVLFWPVLWHDPLGGITAAFQEMNHYPWTGLNLYFGQLIPAQNLPWHYLPAWIGLTSPLMVVIGFVTVHLIWLPKTARGWHRNGFGQALRVWMDNPEWMMILAWVYAPLAVIWVSHANLYDGWRQVFFIYPAVVLLACEGLRLSAEGVGAHMQGQQWVRMGMAALIGVGLLEPVGFIFRYHPYENVYFNALAGDPATLRHRFDMDYWGLSYKQAINYILASDSSKNIRLAVQGSPGKSYIRYMLPASQAERLTLVEEGENPDYFVTAYRMHPEDYDYPDKVFSISVRGSEIITVFRLHP